MAIIFITFFFIDTFLFKTLQIYKFSTKSCHVITFFDYFCILMKDLSILIPTYNDECLGLVSALQQQAVALGINYEIIVADDGSTNQEVIQTNQQINTLAGCRMIARGENIGRAAIRNFLVQQAQYEWLLFIDSDMIMHRNDYLQRYQSAEGEVVCGGVVIKGAIKGNLRSMYEARHEQEHTAVRRQQHPYQDFHTANFLIRRQTMTTHLFDERFRYYGYEDVLLGKRLEQDGIPIHHIDNPLSFEVYETNEAFVSKTEEGLRTLHQFRNELRGYSRLLDFAERHPLTARMVRLWHLLAAKWERRHLCGNAPTLTVFNLYRLGYFLQL
jgi:glycosyltransferase involved in cell wall biosynthesis